jgi:CRP-like cAMP-binding protein
LRKNESTENTPFIFLTARTERGDFRKGMEMGADDYITKPFDDIELLNAIEIRLKKYDVLQGKYAADEKGVSGLISDLNASGMLRLDPDNYETEDLSKKLTVYMEGRRPKYLYYLKKGKVKAFRVHEDGKEYITNLYTAGDYIGYLPMLENKLYEDSAVVLEDAELAQIPRDEFLDLLYKDIHIATKFIRLIAQNVHEKEERLLSLAYGSLRKRVAKALIDIEAKFNSGSGEASKGGGTLDISREDIAQYVGTATESLIRTLSDFKSEKLIEIKDGKIRISDMAKLKNLLY